MVSRVPLMVSLSNYPFTPSFDKLRMSGANLRPNRSW